MNPFSFAIIGGGWRAEFFLRVAGQLSDKFQATGVLVRNEEKARAFEQKWGVPTFQTMDSLLKHQPIDFVVLSVPRDVAPVIMLDLSRQEIPVLCETPPAKDLDGLVQLYRQAGPNAKIQIAEQYIYQPNHAARLQIARSGKLGTVSQAQVSAAHDYHGISLIRHFLGITYEDAIIQGFQFDSPLVSGPGRNGPPQSHQVHSSRQTIASLRFGDQMAVYDFTGDQYFSWIRSPRVLVRGDQGEINNLNVSYLKDYQTPIEAELKRTNAGNGGNLEGYYLKGILLGEDYVYKNPYIPGRLTDDELAVATCMENMGRYAKGGPSFYSLAEASQDHYLALMIQKAIAAQETVTTVKQIWAEDC